MHGHVGRFHSAGRADVRNHRARVTEPIVVGSLGALTHPSCGICEPRQVSEDHPDLPRRGDPARALPLRAGPADRCGRSSTGARGGVRRGAPNTPQRLDAATRYRALQRLFKFLVDEGEVANSPMARMRRRSSRRRRCPFSPTMNSAGSCMPARAGSSRIAATLPSTAFH